MKPGNLTAAFAIVVFIFSSMQLKAQKTPKEVIERTWYGASVQNADFAQGGKAYLRQTMNLKLYSDNTISGTTTTTIKIDGVSYTAISKTSGRFNPADWSFTIKDDYRTREDKLPYELRWCKGNGTLNIFTHTLNGGNYMIRGKISDDCGGTSEIELTDKYTY